MGRAGPGKGQDGMGGPGREGEGQLLNSIVVEALARVCESEAKIECNLEFRIPQIKSIEISYAISHTICRRKRTMCCPKHTMSHTICNIRHRMWNMRYRKLHTTSYVGHPISYVAISYVPRIRYRTSISYVMTYDIVRVRYRTSRPTISYVYIGIIRYRTSDVRYRRLARIQMGRVPLIQCYLNGNTHNTIPHKYRGAIPAEAAADSRPDSGTGSRLFEVNVWMWRYGRTFPREISVADTIKLRKKRLAESRIRAAATMQRRRVARQNAMSGLVD